MSDLEKLGWPEVVIARLERIDARQDETLRHLYQINGRVGKSESRIGDIEKRDAQRDVRCPLADEVLKMTTENVRGIKKRVSEIEDSRKQDSGEHLAVTRLRNNVKWLVGFIIAALLGLVVNMLSKVKP